MEDKNRATMRDIHYRKNFGISLEDYEIKLNAQGGTCAICDGVDNRLNMKGEPFNLSVDHCHNTGKIRDLLCGRCNWFVGIIEKGKADVRLLEKVMHYIRSHNTGWR